MATIDKSQAKDRPRSSDQGRVIAFLSSPDSHAGAAVEVIHTHCSVIFLAGERAYKLKRAVKFPFLDYSTLDLRQTACEKEVVLNRRTAPEIYLGTCPIVETPDGGLALDGVGRPVEWVVVMQRFSQSGLFSQMAAKQKLTAGLLKKLARQIADFHRRAASRPEMGGAAEMHHLATDNSLDLRRAAPEIWSMDRVVALEKATLSEIDRYRKLLDNRRRSGHVRLCHGDLHLRNICLIDGRPTLFDAIEFDEKIACIDVLYDLAFLLMDLEAQNLRSFANIVVNEYLAETGDWQGVKLLPLFMSIRAAIRAKVSEAAAAYACGDEEKSLHDEARHFFELAEKLLCQHSGRVIAIAGLSGSGKSTVAASVAPRLGASPGAILIKSDVLRKQKFAVPQKTTLSQSAYTKKVSQEIYRQLGELTLGLAVCGFTVIADAAFLQEDERIALEQNASAFNIDFSGLWIDVSPGVQDQRLRDRVGDVSDATVEVGQTQRNYNLGNLSWVHLDGDRSINEVTNAALTLLIP